MTKFGIVIVHKVIFVNLFSLLGAVTTSALRLRRNSIMLYEDTDYLQELQASALLEQVHMDNYNYADS